MRRIKSIMNRKERNYQLEDVIRETLGNFYYYEANNTVINIYQSCTHKFHTLTLTLEESDNNKIFTHEASNLNYYGIPTKIITTREEQLEELLLAQTRNRILDFLATKNFKQTWEETLTK